MENKNTYTNSKQATSGKYDLSSHYYFNKLSRICSLFYVLVYLNNVRLNPIWSFNKTDHHQSKHKLLHKGRYHLDL